MTKKICKDIHRVSNKLGRKIDSIICIKNLTHSQYAIISYVYDNNNREVFQRDIEEEFGIRRSSVSAMLSNLEDKGYIVRSSVTQDARLKKITVTDKGINIVITSRKIIEDYEKSILSNVPNEKLDIFYEVLNMLYNLAD